MTRIVYIGSHIFILEYNDLFLPPAIVAINSGDYNTQEIHRNIHRGIKGGIHRDNTERYGNKE